MRPTGPKAEAPPAASRVNMSEYQNTPSPSRLTARNTIRTGAMRTAPLKRMHSAESRRRRRSSPDSSLDMDGLLAHRVDPGTTRSGDGAQHALQIVERPAPGCRFGGTPCFGPQAQPQVGVSREPGGRVVVGDHGQSAGHRFEGHVAEGLRNAGEKKDVRRGIVLRQIAAGAHSRKDEVGVPGPQLGGLGTVSDED